MPAADFDEPIDRLGTLCSKWDDMHKIFGVAPQDGIAMWVADMDFRPPAPVQQAVEAMARICLGAERQFQTETDFNASPRNLERADQAIAMATMFLSQHVGVRAIVAMTESGGTARYLSRFRAKAPVFAVTRHDGARRQMALMRDVFPINFDSRGLTPREAARGSIRLLVESELLQAGDRVVFTSGEHMETHGATNTLRLLEVGEDGRAIGLGDL